MNLEKSRENRLRRAAARRGLTLGKSRVRDPLDVEFGLFWLYLAGEAWPRWTPVTPRDGLTLDEVEVFLAGYRPQRVPPELSGTGQVPAGG